MNLGERLFAHRNFAPELLSEGNNGVNREVPGVWEWALTRFRRVPIWKQTVGLSGVGGSQTYRTYLDECLW